MATRVKMTVSLDAGLVRELEGVSRRVRKPKSRLVEEALEFWRRSRLEQELKEGYRAMAKEDRFTAERNMAAGVESLE